MKMDNNEPVNLQGANGKGKSTYKKNGSSGTIGTIEDGMVMLKNKKRTFISIHLYQLSYCLNSVKELDNLQYLAALFRQF
jgi:ABC-type cobalamin/Fe3+-siderophores transport system ATPase subunit